MPRILIHARRDETGEVLSTWLIDEGGGLALLEEPRSQPLPLPAGAIAGVFARYGKPFEAFVLATGPTLLAEDGRLCCFQHRAFGDVYENDFLLWTRSAGALVAPARLVSAALGALARQR